MPVETVTVRGEAEGGAALDPTAFATVIRAEDFAGRVTSLGELLRQTVGVQVRSLGGEFATVSIRGSTAEQVVVYLDGVPLNRALGGAVNLADLPLGQIESIEIYRGFTPSSLSEASIGGAVLIHTRRPDGRRAGAASASFGSFETGELSGSFSGSRGRADYRAGLDAAASGGDFRYLDDNGTDFTTDDDETVRRVNNGFHRLHLSGGAVVRAGERTRFEVSADVLRRDQGVPGIGAISSPTARFDMTREILRSSIEAPGLLDGRLLVRGAFDVTRYAESYDNREGPVFTTRTDNRIGSFGQEAGFVFVPTRRQAISFLAAHRRETADLAELLVEPSDRGSAARDSIVLTLEDQVSFASGRVLLNPSLRREIYTSTFRPGPAAGLVPLPPAAEESEVTGKIGFRVRAGERLTVKGNAGRFVRVPDFIEIFGNRGSVRGNPALLPERGTSADIGIAFSRRAGPLLRQLKVEGTLFETRADDLVVYQSVAQGIVVTQNYGRARVRGAELSLSFAAGPRFSGSLNATRQRAVNISGDPNDGRLLPGRTSDEVSASAAVALGGGRLFYEFTYVGRNYVDVQNTPSAALPARYLHDIGYHLRLRRGLTLTAEIDNLTGRRTLDVARFPLPGRSFSGRLAWEF